MILFCYFTPPATTTEYNNGSVGDDIIRIRRGYRKYRNIIKAMAMVETSRVYQMNFFFDGRRHDRRRF